MSQSDEILAALERGERITPLDALNQFRCFRLAARVAELRKAGHPIETRDVRLPNGKRIAEYWMARGQLGLGI